MGSRDIPGWVRPAARSAIFLVGLLVLLAALSWVMQPAPTSTDPWAAVRQRSGQADVLALGSSRTYCTVLPMEMWRESGVTVLDVTSGTQPMSVTAAYLEQALQSQTPRVVMLELYMMSRGNTFTRERAHTNFDWMPRGLPWFRAITASTPPGQWFELFFPLQSYHSRWSQLTRADFSPRKLDTGAYAHGATYLNKASSVPTTLQASPLDPVAFERDMRYVRKIARLCAANHATLLLFTSPTRHQMFVGDTPILDRMRSDLTDFPDVRYLDMNGLVGELKLDPTQDYLDELHLNQRGATKVSVWLARTLRSELGLVDHRNDAFASQWNADLAEWDRFKR